MSRASEPIQILVVDDESDWKGLISQIFETQINEKVWKFHFASNGFEAFKILEKEKNIHIILLDIEMPVMKGLDFLEFLNKQDLLKLLNMAVIIVSAYNDQSNIRKAMDMGAFEFVAKPVNIADLKTAMLKAIQRVSKHLT